MNEKQLYTTPRLIVHGDVVNITRQFDDGEDLDLNFGDRRRNRRRRFISSPIGGKKKRDFNLFD